MQETAEERASPTQVTEQAESCWVLEILEYQACLS